jgi:Fic family protein
MEQYIWQQEEWPHFTWNSAALLSPLGECRLLQGKLLAKLETMGLNLDREAQADMLVEETVKTAAIENEQLDVRSVRSSVARRLGLPSAGMPFDRRIDDLVSVLLDTTQNCEKPLTQERLWGWQAALFPSGYSGMHKIKVGGWRESKEPMRVISGPIGREKVHYEAPPSVALDKEMDLFLKWFADSCGNIEGIVRAGLAHLWFVTIHPFDDGNGRLARAITDMAMAQDDSQPARYYSLSSHIMADRESYYEILEKTQKGSCEVTGWLVWFLNCFSRALARSEGIMNGAWTKAHFWQQYDQIKLSERQKKVVNRLLDTGPEGFEGGTTTQKYASMAPCSRATAFRELDQLFEIGLREWGKAEQLGFSWQRRSRRKPRRTTRSPQLR